MQIKELRNVKRLIEERERLKDRLAEFTELKPINYTGVSSSSPNSDPMINRIIKKEAIEKKLKKVNSRLKKIEHNINSIKDTNIKKFVILKYVKGFSDSYIARDMHKTTRTIRRYKKEFIDKYTE